MQNTIVSFLVSIALAAPPDAPSSDPPAAAEPPPAAEANPTPVPDHDMPDPYAREWEPPPGPPPLAPPIPQPTVARRSHIPATYREGTSQQDPAEVRTPPDESSRDSANRVLYAGIVLAGLGAVSGAFAYRADLAARKAERRLIAVSIPGVAPSEREGPIREIEKQNRITLGAALGAGALGAVGIVLLSVAAARLQSGTGRRRIAARRSPWLGQLAF